MKRYGLLFVLAILLMAIFAVWQGDTSVANNCAHDVIGDVNDDKQVSITDVSILASGWGKTWRSPDFPKNADMDCNGIIGDGDLLILQLGYQLRDLESDMQLQEIK